MNGKLYFTANDSIHGQELWCTDGTSDNTYMLKDIIPGPDGWVGGLSCLNNGILYFNVINTDGTSVIWSTDGTSENTVPLVWNVQDITNILGMTIINNTIIFSATDEIHGNCLYSYKLNYTSIENPPVKDMSFCVYPNPAMDRLWIKRTETENFKNSRLYIIRMDGSVVKSVILQAGEQTINISDLAKGIYIIRLGNSDWSMIKQFIKL
jgi:ELWxxDGT repeat protein